MTKEFSELKEQLHGHLLMPGEPAYDHARKVFNGMVDKKPAAIAQCLNAADIMCCVNFARKQELLLAIKGGGHNAAGLGICDDGLVIDLSLMRAVHVDPQGRTAWVQAGCLLKDIDHATHPFGLALPMGINGTTGIAGLTLGGGLGHLTRHYGLTIDHLMEVFIVLADGSYVRANEQEHPDLFWALRGGGGNFGVVVSFLFRLEPVSTVTAGPMLWPVEDTAQILRWYRDFIQRAPVSVNAFFATMTIPPAPVFPAILHGKKMCGLCWCCSGPSMETTKALQEARAVKKPALDFVGPMPLPVLQTMFDALYPTGIQTYWKADFFDELPEAAIQQHAAFGNELPTMLSTMHLYPVDGVASKKTKKDTAWHFREAHWAMVILGADPDRSNNPLITQWAKNYWQAVHPYSMGGAYINFMMEEGAERVQHTYGDNYQRLAGIKSIYDPGNLFRVNQNIQPVVPVKGGMVL